MCISRAHWEITIGGVDENLHIFLNQLEVYSYLGNAEQPFKTPVTLDLYEQATSATQIAFLEGVPEQIDQFSGLIRSINRSETITLKLELSDTFGMMSLRYKITKNGKTVIKEVLRQDDGPDPKVPVSIIYHIERVHGEEFLRLIKDFPDEMVHARI